MRKVFLEDLPKREKGNQIDWKNSIGCIVEFIYDDIKGKLEVIDYNSKNGILQLRYNGIEPYLISYNSLVRCGIGNIINKIVNFPYLVSLLWEPEDACKYTKSSGKKINWKCKNCGEKIKNKRIADVSKQGLSCPKCSDGLKIPEKFMFSLLTKLNINFETQKNFKWSCNVGHINKKISGTKRYDFYIPSLNCIIETHGLQHYKESFNRKGKREKSRTLTEEQENDRLKERLAKENSIDDYFVIDCRFSDLKWMKTNILKSKLNRNDILNSLNDKEWEECFESSLGSRVKEACELWNNGVNNTDEISKTMKLNRATVSKYLIKGGIVGWCDYDPKEEMSKSGKQFCKKIVQLNMDGVFIKEWESASEARRNVKNTSKISEVCRGVLQTAGGFKWMYKEGYEKYIEEQNDELVMLD